MGTGTRSVEEGREVRVESARARDVQPRPGTRQHPKHDRRKAVSDEAAVNEEVARRRENRFDVFRSNPVGSEEGAQVARGVAVRVDAEAGVRDGSLERFHHSSSVNAWCPLPPSVTAIVALRGLPVGGTQSMRCVPAGASKPVIGVTPRATPSIDTEHQPGVAVIESRPLPFGARAATGSESIEMTGTSLEAPALGAAEAVLEALALGAADAEGFGSATGAVDADAVAPALAA